MRISLFRLARRRLRHQRGVAGALAAGLAAAIGLAATVLVAQAVAAETGLRKALDSSPDGGLITIETRSLSSTGAYDGFQTDADRRVTASLGRYVEPVARFAALASSPLWTVDGQRFRAVPSLLDPNPPTPALGFSDDLAPHVRVVAGTLPADVATAGDTPVAAPVSQPFGLRLGDRMCLGFLGGPGDPDRRGLTPLCLRIVAFYQPLDAPSQYWQGRDTALELLAGGADAVFGGLATMNQAAHIVSQVVTAGRTYRVALRRIDATNAPLVAEHVRELHGHYAVQTDALFSTQVDGEIQAVLDRRAAGAYVVQFVAAALLLVALFAISFVARQFLDGQATELGALRARGWRRRRVWGFLLLQLGLLVAVAVPAGLAIAALAALALGRLAGGPQATLNTADLTAIAPPLAAVVAAAALLLGAVAAVAARHDVLELRRGASRPAAPQWWRWRGADVLAAVLALPLLAESRLRGGGLLGEQGTAADPLSLLFPGVAIALLAIAGLRLLPLISRGARRLAAGVAGQLAGWQLGRRPAQHAGVALLATFAVAVGIFSSVYATTDHRNALDRAAYQAGADLRVHYGAPEPALGHLIASLRGVAAASSALRTAATPGSADANSTVLAVDPATFPTVGWSRPELGGPSLDDLMRQLALRDPDGIVLPGRPQTVSVWASYDGTGGLLEADLVDASGYSGTADLGLPAAGGWQQLAAPVRFPGEAAPAYPVRLRRLVVDGPAHGRLALSELAAGGAVVEAFDAAAGWWTRPTDDLPAATDVFSSMAVPREGRPTLSLDVSLPYGGRTIEPAPSTRPVPAVVSTGLLAGLSIGLEQPFPLHFDTGPVQVTAVRAVDSFPTLYPADAFIVLPLDAVLDRLAPSAAGPTPANEVWLRLGGPGAPPARSLRAAALAQEVDLASDLQAAALADPLRLALDATLAVGFLATLAVAVLAFGIHFLAAARARVEEYAILRANGLSPGQVARSLLFEQAVLLAHGLLVGGALGIAVAYAVLPAVQLGGEPTDVVPATVVTLDPAAVAGAGLAVLAGGLLVGWLARRSTTRLDVRQRLRQLG